MLGGAPSLGVAERIKELELQGYTLLPGLLDPEQAERLPVDVRSYPVPAEPRTERYDDRELAGRPAFRRQRTGTASLVEARPDDPRERGDPRRQARGRHTLRPVKVAGLSSKQNGEHMSATVEAHQPAQTSDSRPTMLVAALREVEQKRSIDLIRFRTCCADPRASK